jgi:hypothetical protein
MVWDNEPACESVQPCPRGAQDDETWLRQIQQGESAAIVATYQEAVAIAAQVRAALDRMGIPATDAVVVASLTDAGRPVAWLTLTPTGRRRLGSLRSDWRGGPLIA